MYRIVLFFISLISQIICFVMLGVFKDELLNDLKSTCQVELGSSSFLWMIFELIIIAGWAFIMLLITAFGFAILIPFALTCNFIFYKSYLKRISIDKDRIIHNLNLVWNITTPFVILLSYFSYRHDTILFVTFAIQNISFAFITKLILKKKIVKMNPSI